jgi:hypothetical protein
MDWTCSIHGREEKVIQASGQKPEGKRSLRGYSRGSEDNIKMHLVKKNCRCGLIFVMLETSGLL